MTVQAPQQIEEELITSLTLLIAIASCTESDVFTDWHQSLQSNIQGLMSTIDLLQKHSALEAFQKKQLRA